MDLNSSHDVSSPTAKDASSGVTNSNPTEGPDLIPNHLVSDSVGPPVAVDSHNRAEPRAPAAGTIEELRASEDPARTRGLQTSFQYAELFVQVPA